MSWSPISVARSHPGCKRELNEDRVLDQPDVGLWAVADGMGGHADGAGAADRLIAALAQPLSENSGYRRLQELVRRVERVNAELMDQRVMGVVSGATLVAVLVQERHYACLWAGDSRAYLLRQGRLQLISRDHSRVQELIDHGLLQEAQRRSHPQAHVITRAVGAEVAVRLEQRFDVLEAGDILLLCSDGLSGVLSEAEMARAIDGAELEQSADRLMQAALSAGAPDNVSLVLIG